MPLTAVIVDDEPPARKRIADLLRGELDIRIVAQCGDAVAARSEIIQRQPQLLFLDVQMPELSGFDLLKDLPETGKPAVIFVTAHQDRALDAFGADAVDYLLKPFTRARFLQALGKARQQIIARQTPGSQPFISTGQARITIKNGDRIAVLKPTEIDWIESSGNYQVVHIGKETHLLRGTLKSLEDLLPKNCFVRISRSAMVNCDRIKELASLPGGQHIVILESGQKVPMTRPWNEVAAEIGV